MTKRSDPEVASPTGTSPASMRYVVLPAGASASLTALREAETPGVHWTRLGDRIVIWSRGKSLPSFLRATGRAGLNVSRQEARATTGALMLVGQVGSSFEIAHPEIAVVVGKGRYLVVDFPADATAAHVERDHVCWSMAPLPVDSAVFEEVQAGGERVAWVADLVGRVTEANLLATVTALSALPTRHSLSPHFGEAARWARDQLLALGCTVALPAISVGGGSSCNVVADLRGHGAGERKVVLVTAHLDSINIAGGSSAVAPGADDNASGSAGVLEMARVLAGQRGKHDLRFVLFGGEEEGLHGSQQYVAGLPAAERGRILAVVNMDMIATLNTAAPTVLLEGGAGVSEPIMDCLAAAGGSYTSLRVQRSLNPFASDHVPFIQANLPAVLTIEGADSSNGNIHTAGDTLTHIHAPLAAEIVRMNLASVAELAECLPMSLPEPSRPSASGPVVSWGRDCLDAFCIDRDSALRHLWWDGATWRPPAPETLGGRWRTPPALVSWSAGRLDVFGVGADSALYHKWWNGSTWGPSPADAERLGGILHHAGKGGLVGTGPPRPVRRGGRFSALSQVVERLGLGTVAHGLGTAGRGVFRAARGGVVGAGPARRVRRGDRLGALLQVLGRRPLGAVAHRLAAAGRRLHRPPARRRPAGRSPARFRGGRRFAGPSQVVERVGLGALGDRVAAAGRALQGRAGGGGVGARPARPVRARRGPRDPPPVVGWQRVEPRRRRLERPRRVLPVAPPRRRRRRRSPGPVRHRSGPGALPQELERHRLVTLAHRLGPPARAVTAAARGGDARPGSDLADRTNAHGGVGRTMEGLREAFEL